MAVQTMAFSITPSGRDFVRERAAIESASVSEYIRSLIAAEQRRLESIELAKNQLADRSNTKRQRSAA